MNTQYRKNLKAVLETSKNYTDKEVKKAKDELITFFSRNTVDTDDHTNELAYQITAPSGAKLLQLQAIGGNTVKLSPSVASDSTKAMIKTMPSTVYTFDGSKFYGDSEVSENLIDNPNTQTTTSQYAVTFTPQGNGTYKLSGTATGRAQYTIQEIVLSAGNYVLKDFGYTQNDNVGIFGQMGGTYYDLVGTTNGQRAFTTNASGTLRIIIDVRSNVNVDNIVIKPMLVKGSTAPSEFKVGFSDIHNIELTGIRSEGYNKAGLVDVAETTGTNSVTYKVQDNVVSFKGTNTASISSGILLALKNNIPAGTYSIGLFNNAFDTSQDVRLRFNYSDGSIKDLYINNANYSNNNVVLEKEVVSLYIRLGTFSNSSWVEFKVTLALGTTSPTDFVPYIQPTTKTIDLSTILYNGSPLFEGNSLKAVNDIKDILTPYKATKKLGYVDLGSLNYTYVTDGNYPIFVSSALSDIKVISSGRPNFLSNSKYTLIPTRSGTAFKTDNFDGQYTIRAAQRDIMFQDANYTSESAFKTAMSGVYLVYALATPIEVNIDWSATLRNIQGYPNGSIIAENTNNMDVESVITYNSIIQETLCPSVTVEGANILNPDNTFTYSTYTDLAYFECVGGATYTLKSFGTYTGSFGIFKYDGNSWSAIEAHALNSGYTITAPSDAIRIGVNGVVSQSVMAVRGSTAPTTFRPYKASITRNLPTQASDGYGVNANAHNLRVFSDYEGNAVNKRYTNVNKNIFTNNEETYTRPVSSSLNGYQIVKNNSDWKNGTNNSFGNFDLNVGDSYSNEAYTLATNRFNISFNVSRGIDTIEKAKQYIGGRILYYELADTSKTETDIDDFDYFFDVEEGDVITFNNPYAQQVYATYSFIIKEAKSNE